MTTKKILGEVVFMSLIAFAMVHLAMRDDGVGTAITVVGVSMFAGFGACWRLMHPA